jgi:hypothetical protein
MLQSYISFFLSISLNRRLFGFVCGFFTFVYWLPSSQTIIIITFFRWKMNFLWVCITITDAQPVPRWNEVCTLLLWTSKSARNDCILIWNFEGHSFSISLSKLIDLLTTKSGSHVLVGFLYFFLRLHLSFLRKTRQCSDNYMWPTKSEWWSMLRLHWFFGENVH